MISQISGAHSHDVGKDRDPTPVAGVHVGVVLHQQIDHLGSVRQCAVQTVQRRPAVFIACVRQAWIVRQQHANPVGSIAADRVMDPGTIDQQVDAVAPPEVPGPANRCAVVHLVADSRIGPAVEQEADRRLDLRAGETPVRGGNAMQHRCPHVEAGNNGVDVGPMREEKICHLKPVMNAREA